MIRRPRSTVHEHVAAPRPRPTGRAAFTLLELVIVLCIMTIVALIAQPRLAQTIQRDRVRRAAQKLASDARLLQSEAVRLHTATAMGFKPSDNFYALWYYQSSTSKWKALDYLAPRTSNVTSFALDADYKIAIAGLASGATVIRFDRYGLPMADETVTLGLDRLRVDVTFVSGSGAISVGHLYEASARLRPTQTAWPDDNAIRSTAPN